MCSKNNFANWIIFLRGTRIEDERGFQIDPNAEDLKIRAVTTDEFKTVN